MREVEARIEFLGIIEAADAHARIAHFAVDVGAQMRVVAVERHTVEGRAEAFGRQSFRYIMKTPVGTLRAAFAREHPCRILAFSLERDRCLRCMGNCPARSPATAT
jgi:hypothetical protein